MRSKSQAARETAARCATLAQEADDPEEREYYARLRDAWITLANGASLSIFPTSPFRRIRRGPNSRLVTKREPRPRFDRGGCCPGRGLGNTLGVPPGVDG